jgi:hypothetical protein
VYPLCRCRYPLCRCVPSGKCFVCSGSETVWYDAVQPAEHGGREEGADGGGGVRHPQANRTLPGPLREGR